VPLGVVEFPLIKRLLDLGTLVIAAGGGGPPVYQDPLLGLEGLEAVVDKDRVSSILASQLSAEVLMILTNVDAVFEGWGTPEARPIRSMSVEQAESLIAGGSLDAGGMKPKVEAAAAFVHRGGGRAIIARLSDGPAALRGETGTTIMRAS
jgi:carbamate kinase